MRQITKRLTCVNRGDEAANRAAMEKILNRYVEKMGKNGWKVEGPQFAGNKFFVWEHYVTLVKGEAVSEPKKLQNFELGGYSYRRLMPIGQGTQWERRGAGVGTSRAMVYGKRPTRKNVVDAFEAINEREFLAIF